MNVRQRTALWLLSSLLLLSFQQGKGQVRPVPSLSSPSSTFSASTFFIANNGQWPSDVSYLARLGGMDAWVNNREIIYDFYKIVPKQGVVKLTTEESFLGAEFLHAYRSESVERIGNIVRMEFVGGKGTAVAVEKTRRNTYYNYFIGNDPTQWASHVPLYGGVQLEEIYPGINVLLHFDGGALRYDFYVDAGADAGQIRIQFAGTDGIYLNESGEMVLRTSLGDVVHGSLMAYQEIAGERHPVECAFTLSEGAEAGKMEVGFALGAYDRRYPLVIDPLVYSTFLGGSDVCSTGLHTSAVNSRGNLYITGTAYTGSYPTSTGAYDRTAVNRDLVVTELDEAGSEMIFSTFLGGNGAESSEGLALDSEGSVYVVGGTLAVNGANDFPSTQNAFDRTPSQLGDVDLVVAKLNDSGTQLLYSTFLGGTAQESGGSIDVDPRGNAYITGVTSSRDFPVTNNGFKRLLSDVGTAYDAFVTKVNPSGSALLYSTYLGGGNYEWGYDIVVDGAGYAYVTGATGSVDFPSTPGVYNRAFTGNSSSIYDVFVTKVDTTGSWLVYSTFLGGTQTDVGLGIAIDSSGNVYVTGETHSSNFPITLNAYSRVLSGPSDGFVTKLNNAGSGLYYSTFLGGYAEDGIYGVAVYNSGNAVVTGISINEGYPTTPDAFDKTPSGDGVGENADVVVTKLDASGSTILYSTYLGDRGNDYPEGVVLDPLGGVYVGGSTAATYFPVTSGSYDHTPPSSGYKMFATKLGLPCTMTLRSNSDADICAGSFVQLNTEVVDGIGPYKYSWIPAAGLSSTTIPNPVASPTTTTRYILTVSDAADCVARDTIMVNVISPPIVNAGTDTTICAGESALIGGDAYGARPPFSYSWEPAAWLSDPRASHPVARPKVTTRYVLTVTDAEGCESQDVVEVRVLDPVMVYAGADAAICPGGSVVLGGGAQGGVPPYRYSWEPSLGLSRSDTSRPTASPTATTTYRVMVTDARGCSVTSDSIKVTVRPQVKPIINVSGSLSLCQGSGDSVTLDAGAGYWNYRWSNGDVNRMIRVGADGNYSVVVTNAEGCSGESDTVRVQTWPPPTAEIGGAAIICSGTRGVYSATTTNPDETYQWRLESASGVITSGNGTSNISIQWGGPETATLYLTVYNDLTGCADSTTYQVTVGSELKPVIRGPNILCAGESAELDAGDGYTSYLWSTGERTRTIVVDRSDGYFVTVTDDAACSGTSETFFVTKKEPIEVHLNLAGEIRLCPGMEEVIIAPPGYTSYRWSNGKTDESIRVTDAGKYWVEVTDAEGCVGISDTAIVQLVEGNVQVQPARELRLCDGDSVELRGPEGFSTYQWSTGAISQSIVVHTQGNYWFAVKGSGGCQFYSDTVAVEVIPLPQVPKITRQSDRLSSDALVGNQWLRNGQKISGATDREYVVDQEGEYRVRVENAEGCTVTSNSIHIRNSQGYTVRLNSIGGRVGERLRLQMSITPGLTSLDSVSEFSAWLHFSPDALFPHSAFSSRGEQLKLDYDRNGYVKIERLSGGNIVEGELLFELEIEGLVTGKPINDVVIDSIELQGIGKGALAENGIVLLTGCELGRGFSKGARIVSVAPNPGDGAVTVVYQIPEGLQMDLRIVDMSGRLLLQKDVAVGSGTESTTEVGVMGLDAGLYMIELRDGEEVTTAPLMIRR